MTNKYLRIRPDKSLSAAIKKAQADGVLTFDEIANILDAALDYNRVTDLEYRDLKRFVRTETGLGLYEFTIEVWLSLHYPLVPLEVYPHGDLDRLVGTKLRGTKTCAALVQYSQRAGKARTWRQGQQVKGCLALKKGTPIATFEDGFYPNRREDNHVAYYHSQTAKGITVVDQWQSSKTIRKRLLTFLGKKPNGLYEDASNNGDAMFVIAHKKK